MSAELSLIVVEDNALLREEMVSLLTRPGWRADGVDCGEELNAWLQDHSPDIALLDVNLPCEDGYSIAARLRSSYPQLGIIMLSARVLRGERAAGYQSGADVYLTKPTSAGELMAVIENLARRLPAADAHAHEDHVELCRSSGLLQSDQGLSCQLTAAEARVLEALILAPQRVADVEYLLTQARPRDGSALSKETLAVMMSRIRSKCKQALGLDNIVVAHRGVGYGLSVSCRLRP